MLLKKSIPTIKKTMKTFLYKKYTENCQLLVGGLCQENCIVSEDLYWNNINIEALQKTKDPFFLDYSLAYYISSCSPSEVIAVAGSIYISGIETPCGAVIGSPHKTIQSSQGCVEHIGKNLFCISIPGKMGAFIQTSYKDANDVYTLLQSERHPRSYEEVIQLIKKMYNLTSAFLITADGISNNGIGFIAVSYADDLQIEILDIHKTVI